MKEKRYASSANKKTPRSTHFSNVRGGKERVQAVSIIGRDINLNNLITIMIEGDKKLAKSMMQVKEEIQK